ncbi:hypothetical protein [Actinoplanes aureus]|jgi:hypothetical protein|uniref:Uncharacterized protein n=1 Tax=Actinoplanes aureus TaxID=2792083 RepID=A0A931C956_9ACTN|nr:hypothetical protein [Actinoplanes aureus]MBG0565715.1 hypothetical protein [Actinoplanes aureus]
MSTVIHQPRVVWDGARALVRAAYAPAFVEFAGQVHDLLGPEIHAALLDTRHRLLTESARTGGDRGVFDLEAGRWRVRLEELLHARPELSGAVQELTGRGLEL